MKQIQPIIETLCQENAYSAAVLTDASGFVLAASTQDGSAEASAALVAAIQRVAEQARGRMGLEAMDEVTIFDASGQRLVCRHFAAGDHALFLALKVPPQASYRRATNQAIRQIQAAWTLKPGATGQK